MIKSKPMKKLVVLLLSLCIIAGIVVHVYWLDGIGWALCEFLIGDTEYSTGYREYKFRRIRVGMTEERVVELLGRPLFRTPPNFDVWFYSYGKRLGPKTVVTNSDYTERIVKFKNGVVNEIHHNFYFD